MQQLHGRAHPNGRDIPLDDRAEHHAVDVCEIRDVDEDAGTAVGQQPAQLLVKSGGVAVALAGTAPDVENDGRTAREWRRWVDHWISPSSRTTSVSVSAIAA